MENENEIYKDLSPFTKWAWRIGVSSALCVFVVGMLGVAFRLFRFLFLVTP